MFGATLTWLHVLDYHNFGDTEKWLKINNLPSYNCFSHRNVLQNGVNVLLKVVLKEVGFLSKSLISVHFDQYDLVQISPLRSPNTYQIMYGET